jgi:minichromosome maintenance protein 10
MCNFIPLIFFFRTMGMSTSFPKRKPAYDPARRWGLKPEPDAGGSTYVVSGHIVNGSSMDLRLIYAAENLGREGQAKAKRKLSGKDCDRALKGLLERDGEGMKAVIKAREVGKVKISDHELKGEKDKMGKGKGKQRDKERMRDKAVEDEASDHSALPSKNAYSAEVIKNLGFDPVARTGQRRGGDSDMKKVCFFPPLFLTSL